MRKLAAFRVMPGLAVPTVNEINNKNSRIITYSLLCLRRIVCRFLFKQHTSCPPLNLCCASNYRILFAAIIATIYLNLLQLLFQHILPVLVDLSIHILLSRWCWGYYHSLISVEVCHRSTWSQGRWH